MNNVNPNEKGRPPHPNMPSPNVYEPESLRRAREAATMTDEQARREQRKNKGQTVR
jgi:hypothetical protein